MSGVGTLLFGLPLVVLHVAAYRTHRHFARMLVPGVCAQGTPEQPRACVIGTPRAGPVLLHAPLTGRPCAAWRLALRYTTSNPRGPSELVHHEYSAAAFTLQRPEGDVDVELEACADVLAPPRAKTPPPWLIPPKAGAGSLMVTVCDGQAIVSVDSRLSERCKRAAEASALAHVAKHELPGQIGQVFVYETIVDFNRAWICEGPVRGESDALTIYTDSSAIPVKLAPHAALGAVTRVPLIRVIAVLLLIDLVTLGPIIISLLEVG